MYAVLLTIIIVELILIIYFASQSNEYRNLFELSKDYSEPKKRKYDRQPKRTNRI